MKDIKLTLDNLNIKPNFEIKGYVTVNYHGMYDGVVINTQIIGSNKLIVYKSYNDERISKNVSKHPGGYFHILFLIQFFYPYESSRNNIFVEFLLSMYLKEMLQVFQEKTT